MSKVSVIYFIINHSCNRNLIFTKPITNKKVRLHAAQLGIQNFTMKQKSKFFTLFFLKSRRICWNLEIYCRDRIRWNCSVPFKIPLKPGGLQTAKLEHQMCSHHCKTIFKIRLWNNLPYLFITSELFSSAS